MIHTRPLYSHHWHLKICPTKAPRLEFWHKKNWCQVSAAIRWQLASCWHPLHKLLASQVRLRGTKKWKLLGLILPTGIVTGYGTMASRLWTTLPRSPGLWPPNSIFQEHQVACRRPSIGYRHQQTASVYLPATDTSHRFLRSHHTSVGATVGQMLKCLWWLCWGLVCTICYPHAMYTIKPGKRFWYNNVCCLICWKSFVCVGGCQFLWHCTTQQYCSYVGNGT